LRLFFAVTLPEDVCDTVARVQRELRAATGDEGIRWVRPEQFHYTLKFLGETPEERVLPAMEAARDAATQFAPFDLTLSGLGAFPQLRQPQVLWIGATEGFPLLTQLAESLDRSLAKRRFSSETDRFHPHLTIARIKSPQGRAAAARALDREQNGVDKIAVFVVDSFVLMRSELRPDGPVYTVLETFPLAMP
jgi:2'-5' RNA ligase